MNICHPHHIFISSNMLQALMNMTKLNSNQLSALVLFKSPMLLELVQHAM